MNSIPGKISRIEVADGLSMITVDIGQYAIQAIVIDTPETAPYIVAGAHVTALIKETEILLAHDRDVKLSVRNRLPCRILDVVRGRLLSRVVLSFGNLELNAIVPTEAIEDLKLEPGLDVIALAKVNEVMLSHD